MFIFRGISGRFIFFTADTARAGAPARPACTQQEDTIRSKHMQNTRYDTFT